MPPLDHRGPRRNLYPSQQGLRGLLGARVQAAGLFQGPHPDPYETRRFRPQRRAQPAATAASRATSRSAGTRRWTITANEITRLRKAHGPSSIAVTGSSHDSWGNISYRMSALERFWNMIGCTWIDHDPDSWQGWYWGAIHAWGYHWRLGQPPAYDLLTDTFEHTEMIVFWSSDPNTTSGDYAWNETDNWRFHMKKLGIKFVFIDPFCNFTSVIGGDKWIAPKPGTDYHPRAGHRLHLAHREQVRQGIRRHPYLRLRQVESLCSGRGRRRSQDPQVGRRDLRGQRLATSSPWPGNGPRRRWCWPPAGARAWGTPCAPPTAMSGRG